MPGTWFADCGLEAPGLRGLLVLKDQTWNLALLLPQPSRRCPQPQRPMSSRTDDVDPIQPRCLPPVPRAYRLLHATTERMDRILGRAHSALIVFGGFYVLSVALLAIPLVQRQ